MPPTLEVLTGKSAGSRVDLGTLPVGEVLLGTRRSAGLVLRDPWIAFTHAAITRAGERWLIADRESKSGTFVNGERVSGQGRPLADGDTIELGKTQLRFVGAAARAGGATAGTTSLGPFQALPAISSGATPPAAAQELAVLRQGLEEAQERVRALEGGAREALRPELESQRQDLARQLEARTQQLRQALEERVAQVQRAANERLAALVAEAREQALQELAAHAGASAREELQRREAEMRARFEAHEADLVRRLDAREADVAALRARVEQLEGQDWATPSTGDPALRAALTQAREARAELEGRLRGLEDELGRARAELQAGAPRANELEAARAELEALRPELEAARAEARALRDDLEAINEDMLAQEEEYQRRIAELSGGSP